MQHFQCHCHVNMSITPFLNTLTSHLQAGKLESTSRNVSVRASLQLNSKIRQVACDVDTATDKWPLN